MGKGKKLSRDDTLHLAKLSGLELKENEITSFEKKLGETLEKMENLNELKMDEVAAATNVSGLENVGFEDGQDCERMFTEESAVKNSKKHKKGYFVVDKIL